jgi:hypothetical protein
MFFTSSRFPRAAGRVLTGPCLLALLASCGDNTTLRPALGPAGVRDCNAWVYAATCHQLRLKDGVVTIDNGSFTNPASSLPRSGQPGTITNLDVRGRYDTKVQFGLSPSIALGIPPPACALVNPAFTDVGSLVLDFQVTGSYKYILGNGYRDANNTTQTNGLITDSSLAIPVFNIHNAPSQVDSAAKDLAKDTVKRAVDERVSQKLNEVLALGSTPISGLPVYAPGFNPHNSSCR